jgi:hypothetical protein
MIGSPFDRARSFLRILSATRALDPHGRRYCISWIRRRFAEQHAAPQNLLAVCLFAASGLACGVAAMRSTAFHSGGHWEVFLRVRFGGSKRSLPPPREIHQLRRGPSGSFPLLK